MYNAIRLLSGKRGDDGSRSSKVEVLTTQVSFSLATRMGDENGQPYRARDCIYTRSLARRAHVFRPHSTLLFFKRARLNYCSHCSIDFRINTLSILITSNGSPPTKKANFPGCNRGDGWNKGSVESLFSIEQHVLEQHQFCPMLTFQ